MSSSECCDHRKSWLENFSHRFNQTNINQPSFRVNLKSKIFENFNSSSDNEVFRIFVFAKNQKGRSQGTLITEFHLGNHEKQSHDLRTRESQSPVVLGFFSALIIASFTIVMRLFWKSKKRKKHLMREHITEDKSNIESTFSLLNPEPFPVSIQ